VVCFIEIKIFITSKYYFNPRGPFFLVMLGIPVCGILLVFRLVFPWYSDMAWYSGFEYTRYLVFSGIPIWLGILGIPPAGTGWPRIPNEVFPGIPWYSVQQCGYFAYFPKKCNICFHSKICGAGQLVLCAAKEAFVLKFRLTHRL